MLLFIGGPIMDKINKEDTDTKKDSNNNYKHQNDHIDRQGLNGYQKTDLDLEIERELQEMMENGESNKETKSKHFKILSFVSMIVIVVIAIIRFIKKTI
ncbi:hypothetical protein CTJ09_09940 [Staphylococcus epidermidis]|nr:hypothetical protein CTJ09_09940 [Staphylococcus epidermidis]RST33870.1 hypothetical protein CTI97_010570 [Staphylococcus epidermidis]